jgi:ferredoxin, 2Fe-2S
MTSITFILRDGSTRLVTGQTGSVMEAARAANIAGIAGECGGACACGTCHVYLSEDGLRRLGTATEAEENLLEFEDAAGPFSRLSCQVQLNETCEGLVFIVPGVKP